MAFNPVARATPPVALRAYVPEDFEALYAMDQACYVQGIAYSRRELRWFLALPGACCLVAGPGDAIAGFLIGCPLASRRERPARAAHIITLDVLPEHRRRGIGRALVAACERGFAARGVRRIELETATDNQPAVAFWQNCGYRIAGLIPRYYLDRIDAFFMTKNLAASPAPRATPPARET